VGNETVKRPAYYAPTGSGPGDLIALLHLPYTAWHLAYVAIGASLAPRVDLFVLAGTLLAFFFGLGFAAHALDELKGRPLRTGLSDRALGGLALLGIAGAAAVSAVGSVVISPWVWAWTVSGTLLAVGYALEWPRWLHTTTGFALAWGGFPVLVGYWAQTQSISPAVIAVALAAALLSAAQRTLSTPARYLRRQVDHAELQAAKGGVFETWDEARVLSTWERPLRLLAWTVVTLAIGLVWAKL
jgi:hypothetical protein